MKTRVSGLLLLVLVTRGIWFCGSPAYGQRLVIPVWNNQTSQRPLEHFDADDPGTSIVNSYLLSWVSMVVYGQHFQTPSAFEAQMKAVLIPNGAKDVEVFVNYLTGTEGAVIELEDAMIVAFRGTSTNGILIPRFADHIADLNDDMSYHTLGGRSMKIHGGFWHASDSVYPGLRDQLRSAQQFGKKIWLTGHSLGGANVTVTALRLHLNDGVPVQGLETFGSPKVGDSTFRDAVGANGAGGYALRSVSRRWAINGDPIPTFFERDLNYRWVRSWTGFNYIAPYWVYYRHIGQTNTITRNGAQFSFQYNSGDLNGDWDYGGFGDEHMAYQDALRFEMERILMIFQDFQTIEDLSPTF